jgi:uncharacterized protein (TIGR00369 family)
MHYSKTPGDWRVLDLEDRFMIHVGPVMVVNRPEHPKEPIRTGFKVADFHCNRIRICHGGMLSTLLDIALGMSASVMLAKGGPLSTISMTMDFLQSAYLGEWVESRVRLVHATRRMAFVEGLLGTGDKVILRGNAIYRRPSETA